MFSKTFNRKSFIKGLAAIVAGTVAGKLTGRRVTGEGANDHPFNDNWNSGEYRWKSGTCTLCPSLCVFQARQVELGSRITKLEGEKTHPVNSGALCLAGQASLQHLYNPERIKKSYIKQKIGNKNITAAEALKTAGEFIKNSGKNPLILSREPEGNFLDLIQMLSKEINAAHYNSFPSLKPSLLTNIIGSPVEPYIPFTQNRYVLYFEGSIIEESNFKMSALKEFGGMKREGHKARMIAFTTRQNITSSKADEWYAIKPGTGHVVALGILNLLNKSGNKTDGFSSIKNEAKKYTPEKVEEITGVEPVILKKIAKEFARVKPSLAISECNLTRTPTEKALLTTIMALNTASGNNGKKNGLIIRDKAESIWGMPESNFILPNDLLVKWNETPPSSILHISGDPVFEMVDKDSANNILKDIPMMSLYPYENETNVSSRIRLNTTTHFEEYGILVSNSIPGRKIYSWSQPLIPGEPERLSRSEILLSMMGESAPVQKDSEWFDKSLNRLKEKTGKNTKKIKEELFKNGFVITKSKIKKIDVKLDNEIILKANISNSHEESLIAYPFQTMAIGDGNLNHIPHLRDLGGNYMHEHWRLFAEVNPATLEHLGIHNKNIIRITPRGSKTKPIIARVRENPVIQKGVIALPYGFGKKAGGKYSLCKRNENIHELAHPKEWSEKWINVDIKKLN